MNDVKLTLKSARIVRILLEDPGHPRYGLEIMRYAHIGAGTAYPALAKLEAAGWLIREREDIDPAKAGRPRRTLYRLAPEAVPLARAKLEEIREGLA